jgi:fatty acid amide hydrolase 2
MTAAESVRASALDIAKNIKNGIWSSAEVVEAHIERILAVNPKINALVVDRFEAARKEAADKDALAAKTRDKSTLPSLHGVPCSIKEFLGVTGMPQTAGLLSRRDSVAQKDATVVERLRKEGAIVLGVTNGPEGGMWVETLNHIYGRTNNPWDLSRTPGGSSGGEGALISAGASPFGIGSDISGSIRIPAAFCGVIGHKPTGGLVPNTGHWGENPETGKFLVCGPLGRTVADVEHILGVISKRERKSPEGAAVQAFSLTKMGFFEARDDMKVAVGEAGRVLDKRGIRISDWNKPIKGAFGMWSRAMNAAMERLDSSFYKVLGQNQSYSVWSELARSLFGRSRFTTPALGLVALEKVGARLPRSEPKVDLREVQAQFEDALGDSGVLIVPPYRQSAPRHGVALLTPFDFLFCGVFSVLEFPATVVPTGFNQNGLPVGVQVVARRGNDALTLRVARIIEEELGGWRCAEP